MYFGQGQDFKLTAELSEKVQYSRNQATKNGLKCIRNFFFCLFEKPVKIQKNGVFLFEISFYVLEILTFFYYAN